MGYSREGRGHPILQRTFNVDVLATELGLESTLGLLDVLAIEFRKRRLRFRPSLARGGEECGLGRSLHRHSQA